MRCRLAKHALSRHGFRTGSALTLRARARFSPALRPAVLAATLFLSNTAFAEPYATRDVGRWTVSASSDGKGCFLTRTYRGQRGTTLLFGLDVDGSNRLTLLNANWSVREKDELRLNFRFSKASFPRHRAIGLAANDKKGFVTSFGAAFPATFAASEFIHITRGDVPVEELSLDGSSAAVAELRTCVRRYRNPPAAAGSNSEERPRIPIDPFAANDVRKSKKK